MCQGIPSSLEITNVLHGGLRIDGTGPSPRGYASIEVGYPKLGIPRWGRRHDCNISHVDCAR